MIETALEHSRETRALLDTHVSITEVHLTNLKAQNDRIESAIKWAGGLIISLLISVLGWAVSQQITANEAQKNELRQQVVLLRDQQERDHLESAARAAQAAVASGGVGQGVDLNNTRGSIDRR